MVVLAATIVVAGCGAGGASTIEYPTRDIGIMAPADPGGGYDQTARLMQRALTEGEVPEQNVEVYNVPGASGAIGLTELVNDNAGDPHQLMVIGAILVGAIKPTDVPFDVGDTTPIARLTAEYVAIFVPADSEYETLEQLMEDFEEDPGNISWGGGSVGGVDQILTGQLAQEVGVNPARVNYIPYSGGGELTPALLSEDVTVGVSGLAEFIDQVEAGELRLLAVSSEEPIEGVDSPTIIEAGYDLSLSNWRGVVAPPDIPDEQRDKIIADIEEMHDTPQWEEALETNNWEDVLLTGDEFEEYIGEQDEEIEQTLKELEVIE
ncbi:MAG: Bug family tripartite tricarboxylate transporter substrate binding protein [Rubrobacteraceae bacterium]